MGLGTSPLHPDFGVEVHGVDLRDVTAERGYGEIRALFETRSLLLFRDQPLSDQEHLAFARLFGPLEDREDRPEPEICAVTNLGDEPATLTIASMAPGHARQQAPVSTLPPGETAVRQFRYPGAATRLAALAGGGRQRPPLATCSLSLLVLPLLAITWYVWV